ncbi:uncharacterized protein Dwil_GK18891 [Drosophila willistoni]|uniref:Protein anon-73B1 n=1 Tax=Drosophila willistoni TaxID=7260 RepID=B4N6G6_DROWI|nr:protein anon-73B1 [Drosophila willistoni]EDW79955.1 uncharacterized protein Dwil_GK18891 [Drosophila willistoni]
MAASSAEHILTAGALDKYGDEDWFSLLIRYGLYVGAIFQFVCISAAVLMAGDGDENSCMENHESDGNRGEIGEQREGNGNATARARLHKMRKLEKKKRR